MHKALGMVCLSCCAVGWSVTAVADNGKPTRVAALVDKVLTTRKKFTPRPVLAETTCSITCGNANYTATCADNKECACSCNSGCTCK